jgi:hypothetical protein
MKKHTPTIIPLLLLMVMILCCGLSLTAQETVKRNAMSFSAGAAVPFDEFSYSRFTERAGFARTGANLDAKIIRYGKRKIFGFYADARYAYLFFNEKSYLSEYQRIFQDEGTMSVSTEGYHFLGAEAGFMIRTIAILDTRIILQSGVGYTLCRHPFLSAENSFWGTVNTVNSDLDIQLTGTAGILVEHTIDDYTGIHLSYQLSACRPDFRDRESYREYSYYLPVRIQHINIGLTRYF